MKTLVEDTPEKKSKKSTVIVPDTPKSGKVGLLIDKALHLMKYLCINCEENIISTLATVCFV